MLLDGKKSRFARSMLVQASWMAALSATLEDVRQMKKEQRAKGGVAILKAGEVRRPLAQLR